ncbi:hypothetical protein Nmel_008600, partial [Mimus melanotis]
MEGVPGQPSLKLNSPAVLPLPHLYFEVEVNKKAKGCTYYQGYWLSIWGHGSSLWGTFPIGRVIAAFESRRRMLKHQAVLLEQDNVEFKVTTSMNPAIFLQVSEEAQRPLYHDCL